MRPLKLSMKGFGAFREQTEIDLTDIDLVALVGATGSGKSTIIDAITFALYGEVARYEDRRLVAPVINQTSTEAQVALHFDLDHQTYTAVRVVRRTTGGGATTREARLERGEEILADDAKTMSQAVQGLLGLDSEQFNRTVVLPQGKFADFLYDKPGDRQTTLRQLLGLQMYQRIGQQARQSSERARNQAAALQPEFDRKAPCLTDERREELEERRKSLEEATARAREDRGTINRLADTIAGLGNQIRVLDEKITEVGKISMPADLPVLVGQIEDAEGARDEAEARQSEAMASRRAAEQALENGPDLLTAKVQLGKHDDLAKVARQFEEIAREHREAELHHKSLAGEADRLKTVQRDLDAKVETVRHIEAEARSARDNFPTEAEINAWDAVHNRHRIAVENAETAQRPVESAQQQLPPLREALEVADSVAAKTLARLEQVRRRLGVLGHTDLLEPGKDCPLCLQEVRELPDHTIDDAELRRAEEDHQSATDTRAAAQSAWEKADANLKEREAEATAAVQTLRHYQSEIAAIPPHRELGEMRAKATELAEAVDRAHRATAQAAAEAREHRDSPAFTEALQAFEDSLLQVTRLNAQKEARSNQLDTLRTDVMGLPGIAELQGQIEEAKRLQEERDNADRQLQQAQERYQETTTRLTAINDRRREATNLFIGARDRVAQYGPPPMDRSDLVAAWSTLTDWAEAQKRAGEAERAVAIEQKTRAERRRDEVLSALTSRCAELLGPPGPGETVDDLGIRLAHNLATTETELRQFDQDRRQLRKLSKRIKDLTEQAQVARKLGDLLRTTGFESWLMEAALDRLVEQATERLYELSNGQYSLEIQKREFFVRDHTNAEELRSARTLSGGETFLASLSLALALAEATADLATGVMPTMESIFLDEGFGTLDPDTLDTVATAVEELGAEGRMVGIVTHIRELADRMPVRLELTKSGGTARVARVEN